MKWELTTLLSILQIVCSLDNPNSAVKSNTNLNKPRHKNSKITNSPTKAAIESEISNNGLESFFPDVIYPTSIIDAAQPFYYSPPGFDDVLGPFSNDVKSSFATLTSDKGKLQKHGPTAPKPRENNAEYTTLQIPTDRDNNANVLPQNEPLIVDNISNNDKEFGSSNIARDHQNKSAENDIHETNEAYLLNDEQRCFSQEILEDSNVNLCINGTYVTNMKYVEENNPSATILDNKTTMEELDEENVKLNNNSNVDKTVFVTPNYIMTSETGNSHEDFVSDIMNIFSLIEETIRAISVVEFVVSQTLGALGSEDKQNETITIGFGEYNFNATESPYGANNITMYNYNDQNFVNNDFENSSLTIQ